MANSTQYSTFKQIYENGKEIAGVYGKAYDRSLLLFIFAYVMQGLAYLSIYGLFVGLFASPVDIESAWMWLGFIVLFTLLNGAGRWFAHDFDYTGILPSVTHNMRVKLGQKLRTMPFEKLNNYKTGDLNSSLSSSVEESVFALGMVSGMFLETIVTPMVVIVGMLFIEWRMAVVMMLIMPLAIPLYRRKRRSAVSEKTQLTEAHSSLESDIIEYIQGLPVLRANNQTGVNAKRLYDGIVHVRDLQTDSVWGTIALLLVTDLLILASLVVIAVLGTIWVGDATMSIAALAALLVMVSRLMEPLTLFLGLTSVIEIMSAGFVRVKEIMDIKPLEVAVPEARAQGFDIEFDNVDFRYADQEKKALKSMSFKIPKQAMTAIAGSSGAGKTTITKLMMRYADPQNGTIKIGGVDIRHMSQEILMSHFSVVFQDVYLFDETIIENIRMAKPDVSDDKVIEAAKAAYCDEFIERLPEGYETKVGDIGGSLSGGERQRISIARAILKDAPIVILDEPTAALDTNSELAVQKAIEALVKDKTIIIIAHRLSTLAGADQILVIDGGMLVEKGTQRELLEAQGRYNDMWQAQERSNAWHNTTGK